MTNLEIILTAIIYLIIGLWICWKRDWYPDDISNGINPVTVIFALIFMPINLLIIFIDEFVLKKWNN